MRYTDDRLLKAESGSSLQKLVNKVSKRANEGGLKDKSNKTIVFVSKTVKNHFIKWKNTDTSTVDIF